MERRPPRQLTAREDVTVEVELRKELGEGGVAVLSPLGGPAAPAEQVPAELLALDRAVAVRVDHVEELVCPRVGRLISGPLGSSRVTSSDSSSALASAAWFASIRST